MNKILKKRQLTQNIHEYVIDSPEVSRHCLAGQFIILRVDDEGERIPLTICDYDREAGTVTILVQSIGYSTMKLAKLNEGDYIHDFAGPLGNATELEEFANIILVGGGVGSAVIYPQCKQLNRDGRPADIIIGARNKDLLIYEDEFRANAKDLYVMTDDGSYGEQGFVTTKLKQLLDSGKAYDCVFAVGPMPMMRAVANLTREYGVHTIVSMNSVMVDGTGMCGGCRVTVGGQVKYACVDGPEFDGHLVDFDEAIERSKFYREIEQEHKCKMEG